MGSTASQVLQGAARTETTLTPQKSPQKWAIHPGNEAMMAWRERELAAKKVNVGRMSLSAEEHPNGQFSPSRPP